MRGPENRAIHGSGAIMAQLMQYIANHPWLAGFALLAATAVLVYESRARMQNQNSVSPQDAVRLMNQGAMLLDVRSREEFAAGHVRGAHSQPLALLDEAADTLKKHKEKPVIVCCERGSLSSTAIRLLGKQGFAKVFNLRGGLNAWRTENLPLVRD